MATSTCDRTLMVSLAALQRNLMLGVFGMNATDRTHLAEMSIEGSLCEIVQAEEDTKQQLQVLIDVVRKRDVVRQSAQLKADLVKSSKLRKTLCALQQKRAGMEAQMDKLRESKLNMQMLRSMKPALRKQSQYCHPLLVLNNNVGVREVRAKCAIHGGKNLGTVGGVILETCCVRRSVDSEVSRRLRRRCVFMQYYKALCVTNRTSTRVWSLFRLVSSRLLLQYLLPSCSIRRSFSLLKF